MQDLSFCPKCGAPIQPDFQFCTSCGLALSKIKEADPVNTNPLPATGESQQMTSQKTSIPVQSTTVAPVSPGTVAPVNPGTAAPLFSRQVHLGIILVLFAGVGVWIWTMENAKHKSSYSHTTELPVGEQETPSKDDNNKPSITMPSAYLKAADFAGTWRAYEANNSEQNEVRLGNPDDDLFIEFNNGQFVLYPRTEKGKEYSAEFNCTEVAGNMITCKGKSKSDNETFTLKMEMQPSKNEMTLTIIPDVETELMILKLRRL